MARIFSSLMILTLIVLPLSTVHAVDCVQGMMRLNDGSLAPNSSCENAYLAQVAAQYGIKVSPSELGNPNKKKDVCRTVFTDNRVELICQRAGVPERY